MVKFSKVLIILIFSQSVCFSMTNEKLNRFKWKAKNDISIKAIESYCSKEDIGLEVDLDDSEQMFYSKSCKCAIRAGKTKDITLAQNILDICSL
tara:strand:- start:179 stop:460 length:282 start_codon:yes stop_codon:yes gene_type:complete